MDEHARGSIRPATLADAARVQARPHWDFAAELLLKAAETRKESDIEMATAQMERAFGGRGVAVMPRDGAIIFRDIVGKLDVLTVEHAHWVRGFHTTRGENSMANKIIETEFTPTQLLHRLQNIEKQLPQADR